MQTRTRIPTVTWVTRTRLQLVHREVLKHEVSLLAVTNLPFLTMRSSKQFPCKTFIKILAISFIVQFGLHQYFITPDNLERHIERELNPARVLIHHSMFGADKYGVNDEVALHAMRVHQQQNLLRMDEEKHVEKQGNRKQLFRIGLVDEEVKAANALNEEFGTSAHPIPSSFSTVNSFLFENKFIRDILYPYANVLRDDVMARKKLFEAESELHDNEEDFDEAELTTIDLNDPEDMEMLRELAQEEMIDIEELIQDVQEMQEDEQSRQASQSQGKKGKKGGASSQAGGAFASAGVSTSSHAATSGEEAQRLAVDLKKHQELERIRKSPHVRIDAEYEKDTRTRSLLLESFWSHFLVFLWVFCVAAIFFAQSWIAAS